MLSVHSLACAQSLRVAFRPGSEAGGRRGKGRERGREREGWRKLEEISKGPSYVSDNKRK